MTRLPVSRRDAKDGHDLGLVALLVDHIGAGTSAE
jgi:hypothetical protein